MNILMAYADVPEQWNSSEYRIRIPLEAINRTSKHKAIMISMSDFDRIIKAAPWADAFILERNFFGPYLDLIRYLKQQYPQKALVATFDDGYHHITRDNPGYQFWVLRKGNSPDGEPVTLPFDPLKQFTEGLGLFDAAFLPNKMLVRDYEKYVACEYVPNFHETSVYTGVQRIRDDGKIVIGWGAGGSHVRSLLKSGALDAIKQIMREYEQVEFWAKTSHNILHEIKSRLDMRRVHYYTNWLSTKDWVNVLVNFDIGLALLTGPTGFDARRSWIKISEYMLARVPFVASRSPTYDDYEEYGYLAGDSKEYYQKLKDLIDNRQNYIDTYIDKAYNFALGQDINLQIEPQYIQRLEKILDKKGWSYAK